MTEFESRKMSGKEQIKNPRGLSQNFELSAISIPRDVLLLQDAMSIGKELANNKMEYDKPKVLRESKDSIMAPKHSDLDESFKRKRQRQALQNLLKEGQKVKISHVTKRDNNATMTRVMSQEEVSNARNSFSSMSGLRVKEPTSTIAEIHHPKYDLTRPRENATKSMKKHQERGTLSKEAENKGHKDVQMQQQKSKIFKVKSINKGIASEIVLKTDNFYSGIDKSSDNNTENFKPKIVKKTQSLLVSELPQDEISSVSSGPPSVKDLLLDKAYLEHETFLATQVLACKGDVFTFLLQHRREQEKTQGLTRSAPLVAGNSGNRINVKSSKLNYKEVRCHSRDVAEKDEGLAPAENPCDKEQESGEGREENLNLKLENEMALPDEICILQRESGLFATQEPGDTEPTTKNGQKGVENTEMTEIGRDESKIWVMKIAANESDKSIVDEITISPVKKFEKEYAIKIVRDLVDDEAYERQKADFELASHKEKDYLMGKEGQNESEIPCGSKTVLEAGMEELVEQAKFTAISGEMQEKDCEEEQRGIITIGSPGCTEQVEDEMTENNGKKKIEIHNDGTHINVTVISACVTAQEDRLKGFVETDVGELKEQAAIEESNTLSEQSMICQHKPSYLFVFDNLKAQLDDCELTNLQETVAAEHVVEDDTSIGSVEYTCENNSRQSVFTCENTKLIQQEVEKLLASGEDVFKYLIKRAI